MFVPLEGTLFYLELFRNLALGSYGLFSAGGGLLLFGGGLLLFGGGLLLFGGGLLPFGGFPCGGRPPGPCGGGGGG